MSTNTLQRAARIEAVPTEPQEEGRRTPSLPLRFRRTSPCEGSRRQCRRAHPLSTRCTMLLSEKPREAEPSQHLGTPMVHFCPTSFVERLTERERPRTSSAISCTKTRTAEVTICTIPERTARSPPTVAELGLGPQRHVLHSKASPVRRPYETFVLQVCVKWE